MVSTEQDTIRALGLIQSQHDRTVSLLYRGWLRNPDQDIKTLAEDPELVYSLDAVEAIAAYTGDR